MKIFYLTIFLLQKKTLYRINVTFIQVTDWSGDYIFDFEETIIPFYTWHTTQHKTYIEGPSLLHISYVFICFQ